MPGEDKLLRVGVINDTAVTGHPGCIAVMSTIENSIRSLGFDVVLLWPVGQDWRKHKRFLKSANLDVLIVNGEGTIHHTQKRKAAMNLCKIATFAKANLRIPCHLINATVSNTCITADHHLKNFTSVYVRETTSREYLLKRSIISSVVPDLSLFYGFNNTQKRKHSVLVTDSVIPRYSVLLEQYAKTQFYHFEKMELSELPSLPIRVLRKITGYFELPPSIISDGEVRNIDPLVRFSAKVNRSSGVVTGRFHSVMLSIAMKIPFVAVESNTHKIGSVLADVFGNSNRVVNSDKLLDLSFTFNHHPADYTADEVDRIDCYLNEGGRKKDDMFRNVLVRK